MISLGLRKLSTISALWNTQDRPVRCGPVDKMAFVLDVGEGQVQLLMADPHHSAFPSGLSQTEKIAVMMRSWTEGRS